ncbi:antibiotic biosynthesis monooxygenase [Streptomyces vilmorinianum]|uniref:antibiotic biosynthesis monooxygenase n=1 Tax=Streptomyces vilmorinianum TaxID=3051092 RepID=UPI0010FB472E|nr:antibiotic biosynthesis monooxygenase [Streptomyces vilmorinianum]
MNTVVRRDSGPDPYRPGVGAVLASTWRVGTPERQRAAVDAIAETWESRDWPDGGLLSYTVLIGDDGDTLLHYSQWTAEEAYDDFVRTFRDDRNAEIDAAVPGIDRVALHRYGPPYRSAVLSEKSAGAAPDLVTPGLVVVAEAVFDGADSARQRTWVDDVFAAMDADAGERPAPGGIGAHFHLSTDGTRVLNYAEWESVRAFEEWQAADGADTGLWAKVHHHPGLVESRVRRYTPALNLRAGV